MSSVNVYFSFGKLIPVTVSFHLIWCVWQALVPFLFFPSSASITGLTSSLFLCFHFIENFPALGKCFLPLHVQSLGESPAPCCPCLLVRLYSPFSSIISAIAMGSDSVHIIVTVKFSSWSLLQNFALYVSVPLANSMSLLDLFLCIKFKTINSQLLLPRPQWPFLSYPHLSGWPLHAYCSEWKPEPYLVLFIVFHISHKIPQKLTWALPLKHTHEHSRSLLCYHMAHK